MKTKQPINIKRGLQRIWTVCSIFWAIVWISLTIYYFPEKPSDAALVKTQKNIIEAEEKAKQKKENLDKGKEELKNEESTVLSGDKLTVEEISKLTKVEKTKRTKKLIMKWTMEKEKAKKELKEKMADEQATRRFSKLLKIKYEENKKQYDFEMARYDEEKNRQSQQLFIALGLIPLMWGLLYIGFLDYRRI